MAYDSLPINANDNQIGYPLAPVGGIGAGIDFSVQKNTSVQIIYGYFTFIPQADIANTTSHGSISLANHSASMQLTYKM